MVLALVALIALLGSAINAALRRTLGAALLLSALSGLWLAANNGVVEGSVIVSLNDKHGLTTSDLAGYLGAILAVGIVLRAGRWSRRLAVAAGVAVPFLLGLALSYFHQPTG